MTSLLFQRVLIRVSIYELLLYREAFHETFNDT